MKTLSLVIHAAAAVMMVCLSACRPESKERQSFVYDCNPADLGVTPEAEASLDSLLQSFIETKQMPCVTAFVAKGGNVVYNKAFGLKNIENQTAAQTDDIYILFSQTKAVVAVAMMTLVEQGLVNVEDPVSKWIPDFASEVLVEAEDGSLSTVAAERPVTIAHLLSHSSGYLAPLSNRYIRGLAQEGQDTRAPRTTVRENVDFNKRFPLGFQPGTEWNYNYDMEVIAAIIEIVSGKSLQDYLRETIFEPLGMDYTAYYYDDETLKSRFVTTYSKRGDEFVVSGFSNPDNVFKGPKTYAGGTLGLYGPIEDYAKFCQMLLNGGSFNGNRILKAETIEMMCQNRLPEVNAGGEGFQFGLGFQLMGGTPSRKEVEAMSSRTFRWGGAAGTEYIIDPDNDLVILYYISMWGKPDVYDDFLKGAYGLFGL